MQTFLRKVFKWKYQNIIKPILFKFSPDNVHHWTILAGIFLQKTGLIGVLSLLRSKKSKRLNQEICGVKFENPIGLSAGFDKNIEVPKLFSSLGFGFMTGGSITYGQYEGNEKPWFHRLPKQKALIVNAGLPNIGVKKIVKNINKMPKNSYDNLPLLISVAKTNSQKSCNDEGAIEDYVESFKYLEKNLQMQSIYELNISCPNTFGGEPFTTPEKLDKLLCEISKLQINKPIFVKMPVDLGWTDFDKLLQVIVKYKLNGVTVSNLTKKRARVFTDHDISQIKGGISGLPTSELANILIRQTYQKYGNNLKIIGVGGVFTAEDAYLKIKSGASLVAMITGLIYEGPQVVPEINHQLDKMLKKDGYTNISQAIGTDVRQK